MDGSRRHSMSCAAPSPSSEVTPGTLSTLAAIIRTAIQKGDESHARRSQGQHVISRPLSPCEDGDGDGSPADVSLDLLRRLSDVGSVGSESSSASSMVADVQAAGSASVPQHGIDCLLLRQGSAPPHSPSFPHTPASFLLNGFRQEGQTPGSSASVASDCAVCISESGSTLDAYKACKPSRSHNSDAPSARQVPAYAG